MALKKWSDEARLISSDNISRAGFRWSSIENAHKTPLLTCQIINTDTSDGPGIHWALCYRLQDCYYIYDPLGPEENLAIYFAYLRPLVMCPYKSQLNDSQLCGYFALHMARVFRANMPTTAEQCNALVRRQFGPTADLGDVKKLASGLSGRAGARMRTALM